MKRKVQAQRKFAQGVPLPPNNATNTERRVEAVPSREGQRSIIHNNTVAKILLDFVSFRQMHKHRKPVVVLERLRTDPANPYIMNKKIEELEPTGEPCFHPIPTVHPVPTVVALGHLPSPFLGSSNSSINKNTIRLRSHNKKSEEDDIIKFTKPQEPIHEAPKQNGKAVRSSARKFSCNMSDASIDEDKPLAQYVARKKRQCTIKMTRYQTTVNKKKVDGFVKKTVSFKRFITGSAQQGRRKIITEDLALKVVSENKKSEINLKGQVCSKAKSSNLQVPHSTQLKRKSSRKTNLDQLKPSNFIKNYFVPLKKKRLIQSTDRSINTSVTFPISQPPLDSQSHLLEKGCPFPDRTPKREPSPVLPAATFNTESSYNNQAVFQCQLLSYKTFVDIVEAPKEHINNRCKICQHCKQMEKIVQLRMMVDQVYQKEFNENSTSDYDSSEETEQTTTFTETWQDLATLSLDIFQKPNIHVLHIKCCNNENKRKPILICSLGPKPPEDITLPIEAQYSNTIMAYLQRCFKLIFNKADFENNKEKVWSKTTVNGLSVGQKNKNEEMILDHNKTKSVYNDSILKLGNSCCSSDNSNVIDEKTSSKESFVLGQTSKGSVTIAPCVLSVLDVDSEAPSLNYIHAGWETDTVLDSMNELNLQKTVGSNSQSLVIMEHESLVSNSYTTMPLYDNSEINELTVKREATDVDNDYQSDDSTARKSEILKSIKSEKFNESTDINNVEKISKTLLPTKPASKLVVIVNRLKNLPGVSQPMCNTKNNQQTNACCVRNLQCQASLAAPTANIYNPTVNITRLRSTTTPSANPTKNQQQPLVRTPHTNTYKEHCNSGKCTGYVDICRDAFFANADQPSTSNSKFDPGHVTDPKTASIKRKISELIESPDFDFASSMHDNFDSIDTCEEIKTCNKGIKHFNGTEIFLDNITHDIPSLTPTSHSNALFQTTDSSIHIDNFRTGLNYPSTSTPVNNSNTFALSNNTSSPKTIDYSQTNGGQSFLNAPVFSPTAEEFQDPVAYFDAIMPIASRYGICKVVPPADFAPSCSLNDEMTFNVSNQYVPRLYSRWGTGSKEMSAIKAYLASQSVFFKRAPLYEGMEVNLPKLYQIVQRHGGLKKVIERKRWSRVAEEIRFTKGPNPEKKLDQFYVKYLLPYDTLSPNERGQILSRVERAWCVKYRKMFDRAAEPLHRLHKLLGEASSSEDDDDEESGSEFITGALSEAEECVLTGRKMNLTTFKKVASNALETFFSKFPPTTSHVEEVYWRLVLLGSEHLCINSASIDTGTAGYGFTNNKSDVYGGHPWNLKNLTSNKGNILRYLGPVLGVTVPTLHLGMVFSTSCWHRDPHGLPWMEYLHSGPAKIWYGIPDEQSNRFRKAVEELCPTSCQQKTIWLPSDIAMIPPNLLHDKSVTLSRVEQNPGEYIVVFPKAYSCSISTGFTISESVYFASKTWLQSGQQFFLDAQISSEPTMISIESLVIAIVRDAQTPRGVLQAALGVAHALLLAERNQRLALEDDLPPAKLNTAIKHLKHPPGSWNVREQDECEVCRKSLYLSRVRGLMENNAVLCLEHAISIVNKRTSSGTPPEFELDYFFSGDEIDEILSAGNNRLLRMT